VICGERGTVEVRWAEWVTRAPYKSVTQFLGITKTTTHCTMCVCRSAWPISIYWKPPANLSSAFLPLSQATADPAHSDQSNPDSAHTCPAEHIWDDAASNPIIILRLTSSPPRKLMWRDNEHVTLSSAYSRRKRSVACLQLSSHVESKINTKSAVNTMSAGISGIVES
jgi:hypothetical protein